TAQVQAQAPAAAAHRAAAYVQVKHPSDQDSVVPLSGEPTVVRNDRSIGTILVRAGRLSLEGAEQIVQLQQERGLRFGDAALQLGLLTQADIEFALSRQYDYPYLVLGESKVSEHVIMAYNPFSPQAKAISGLRSQLTLRSFGNEAFGKSLAVISAARGE